MPWEPIFSDSMVDGLADDEETRDRLRSATLSDIVEFIDISGDITTGSAAPTWNVSITEGNVDNMYHGILLTLSTDMSSLQVAYPQFTTTSKKCFKNNTNSTEILTTVNPDYENNVAVISQNASGHTRNVIQAMPGFVSTDTNTRYIYPSFSNRYLKDAGPKGERHVFRNLWQLGKNAYSGNGVSGAPRYIYYCDKTGTKDGKTVDYRREPGKAKLANWGGRVRIMFSLKELKDRINKKDSQEEETSEQ